MHSIQSWRSRGKPASASGWILLWLALVWAGTALADIRDPADHFFGATFGDFSEELETARGEGKQGILLMFEMDECPFCHRMKTTVLNRSEVQDYFRDHFLIFPVDIEGDIEITDFSGQVMAQKDFALKSHRVRATPVFAFFDLDGSLVARYTGATRDADEFMLLGTYVVEGRYKDMSFSQYKRERRETSRR
ncbi:thioredoxin family protein [Thiorhodococcus minor]|uniref:Thioredoxin fold domain-containing protein n=1 Tax=Thiorhodococcus minor TaxID=57489 RepID=A0A6M0JY95_9GAMM|nr:thioredoxin family protein [Thiorhodococcus minor]NEV62139.1 thioredoxin fold domain-containing protein [Thiorhodococcus minor]